MLHKPGMLLGGKRQRMLFLAVSALDVGFLTRGPYRSIMFMATVQSSVEKLDALARLFIVM